MIVNDQIELVSACDVEIPAAYKYLFADDCLIGLDSAEEYRQIRDSLIADTQPMDVIDWIWLRDLLDYVWEYCRARRIRNELIRSYMPAIASSMILAADGDEDPSGNRKKYNISVAEKAFNGDAKARATLNNLLTARGIGLEKIAFVAMQRAHDNTRYLERDMGRAEKRRDQLIKDIEARKTIVAHRMRLAAERVKLQFEAPIIPQVTGRGVDAINEEPVEQ